MSAIIEAKPMSLLLITPTSDTGLWADAFRARAPGRRLFVHGVDRYAPETIRYAIVWKPPRGVLGTLPALEAIFNLGAGVDALLAHPDLPDVPLVRLLDPNLTARMSEWVALQVLTHHRRALAYLGQQARREWRALPQPIAGQVRVGVMGYGVLGSDAADVLVRLGFDVRAWSRNPKPGAAVRLFAGPEALDAFLAETDILVALLPLTGDTRGLLDSALIGRLARDGALGGPVLINAGRGGLQVDADIGRALRDGTLAGASLDVAETEPLPAGSPLWDAPNLVITPHVAADSAPDTVSGIILAQIEAHERGAPLEHVVDRARGY